MPEARDRLPRPNYDVVPDENQRRTANTRGRGRGLARASPVVFELQDANEDLPILTPHQWRGTPMAGTPGPTGLGIAIDDFETPAILEPENLTVQQGRGTPLPPWFQRRPLRDITSIIRAIENRRRHNLHHTPRGGRILRTETPVTLRRQILHTPASGFRTPRPVVKPRLGKVKKILQEVTKAHRGNDEGGDKECNLTPQKRLLNSLETVEEAVKEEICKLEGTPSAKRVEREKRVRTLMSMR